MYPHISDCMVIAFTIAGESIGESWAVKHRVATVIWNRAGGDPARMRDVCLAKSQFCCWSNGDTALLSRFPGARLDATRWMGEVSMEFGMCVNLATSLMLGSWSFQPADDATHFHDDSIQTPRSWRVAMQPRGRSGRMLFFMEPGWPRKEKQKK